MLRLPFLYLKFFERTLKNQNKIAIFSSHLKRCFICITRHSQAPTTLFYYTLRQKPLIYPRKHPRTRTFFRHLPTLLLSCRLKGDGAIVVPLLLLLFFGPHDSGATSGEKQPVGDVTWARRTGGPERHQTRRELRTERTRNAAQKGAFRRYRECGCGVMW